MMPTSREVRRAPDALGDGAEPFGQVALLGGEHLGQVVAETMP
jgi:hypothetical protein